MLIQKFNHNYFPTILAWRLSKFAFLFKMILKIPH